ncbi:plasmid recombination protein [Vibrio toranzoniae]|uniref:plasmid recombination protein n=1 Tax=Vibrio toranzoniae TaxID=1194427 RepID=UPI001378B572|nr:plasmid recombination protein [Vibrio toranzoniae]NAZ92251.1 hypothetical protein [Vibrio toranzoniae]
MYQFLHYETYSINSTKKSKSFLSVAREFMRHPNAIPHVEKPLQPQVLFGVDAYEVERIARERAAIAKDAMGRKLRKDAQVVLSAVASAPNDMPKEDLVSWTRQTIKWFKKKYGDNFISCILHVDESHPHLHLTVVIPETTEKGKANLKHLHEPIRARQDTDGGRKAKSIAYKEAYRALQDEYHCAVSSNFGMLRLGAHKQRLTRAEYNAQKAAAKTIADSKKRVIAIANDVAVKQENLKQKETEITTREDDLQLEQYYVDSQKTQLQKRETKVEKKVKAIKEESSLLLVEHAKNNNKPRIFFMKKINKALEDVREYKGLYQKYRKLYLKLKNAYDVLFKDHEDKCRKYDELHKKYIKNVTLLKQLKKGEVSIKLVPENSYDCE